jgi:hypothetical protein
VKDDFEVDELIEYGYSMDLDNIEMLVVYSEKMEYSL